MAGITVVRVVLEPASASIQVQYSEEVTGTLGTRLVGGGILMLSELDPPLNAPDWDNADLLSAIATKLGVFVNDVQMQGGV